MQSSVLKLRTWGGDGGVAHDITVAPQRLESITIRNGKVIDSIVRINNGEKTTQRELDTRNKTHESFCAVNYLQPFLFFFLLLCKEY
jgi:hypothetical protein